VTASRVSVLTLVLLLAACGTPAPSGTGDPSPVVEVPVPTLEPRTLVGGRLTCGDGDTFPGAALQGPGGAELGGDAAAAALRTVLAEGGDPQLPRSGWHRVAASDSRAQFVARGVGTPWVVIAVENGPSGWSMDLAGECRLTVVIPAGLNLASWWIDPAAGVPGPEATTLKVLVHEQCGRSAEGRIAAPAVIYQPDAIIVVFGVVKPSGGQDTICLDSPPTRYEVVLTEPLGQRRLLDGGVVPPRDATKPPS
jgi:hypothetical protein